MKLNHYCKLEKRDDNCYLDINKHEYLNLESDDSQKLRKLNRVVDRIE